MKELKPGTKVLVEVEIIRRAKDAKPREKCGYVIRTSRGSTAYVNPSDIWCSPEKPEER